MYEGDSHWRPNAGAWKHSRWTRTLLPNVEKARKIVVRAWRELLGNPRGHPPRRGRQLVQQPFVAEPGRPGDRPKVLAEPLICGCYGGGVVH